MIDDDRYFSESFNHRLVICTSDRASPIFGNIYPLYPRLFEPGIAQDKLPPIDIVLISHNHRDHMDGESLLHLKKHHEATFLVPWGDKAWFDARGFERVIEHIPGALKRIDSFQPAKEMLFLDRSVAGLYGNLRTMRARVPVLSVLSGYLERFDEAFLGSDS